jgi:hypothetical protein
VANWAATAGDYDLKSRDEERLRRPAVDPRQALGCYTASAGLHDEDAEISPTHRPARRQSGRLRPAAVLPVDSSSHRQTPRPPAAGRPRTSRSSRGPTPTAATPKALAPVPAHGDRRIVPEAHAEVRRSSTSRRTSPRACDYGYGTGHRLGVERGRPRRRALKPEQARRRDPPLLGRRARGLPRLVAPGRRGSKGPARSAPSHRIQWRLTDNLDAQLRPPLGFADDRGLVGTQARSRSTAASRRVSDSRGSSWAAGRSEAVRQRRGRYYDSVPLQ